MISYNEIKKGTILKIDDELYSVTYFQHVKPGKGSAFVRTKMRNLMRGTVLERTFKNVDKIEDVQIENRDATFLYQEDNNYIFMDSETYEQEAVSKDVLGDDAYWLKENMEVITEHYEGKIIFITLPNFVELEITETEPGFKGDTVSTSYKPAVLETGATVQVPLFISEGEVIKVDTRSGEYVERVSGK